MNKKLVEKYFITTLLSFSVLVSPSLVAKEKGNYLHQKIQKMELENNKFEEFNLFKQVSDSKDAVIELQQMSNELLAIQREESQSNSLEEKSSNYGNTIDELSNTPKGKMVNSPLAGAEFLTLNKVGLKNLQKRAPKALIMPVPFKHQTNKGLTKDVKIKLFKRKLYTKDAEFVFQDKQTGTSRKVKAKNLDLGVHYHGVV